MNIMWMKVRGCIKVGKVNKIVLVRVTKERGKDINYLVNSYTGPKWKPNKPRCY